MVTHSDVERQVSLTILITESFEIVTFQGG